MRRNCTYAPPIVAPGWYAARSAESTPACGAEPAAAASSSYCSITSPSGISAITTPSLPWRGIVSFLTAPSAATAVHDASAKSASSVAAQNTGAAGMPVSRSMRSASVSADIALSSV